MARTPVNYRLANRLVFRKVRKALGLDRCTKCYTGAAPITKDTLEFFLSLDIPVYELYGMSESTGPHTISLPNAFRLTRYLTADTLHTPLNTQCLTLHISMLTQYKLINFTGPSTCIPWLLENLFAVDFTVYSSCM
jgi:acyl-CoA synthetase (AMP-forming)/AMP-acid ligase II